MTKCKKEIEVVITMSDESKGLLNSIKSILCCKCKESITDTWKVDTNYKVDDVVTYQGSAYTCIQSHRSTADKTPDVSTSLWTLVN